MKLLIADDSRHSRAILEWVAREWGYEPILAEDGEAAWQVMQADDPPRLLLLDWEMPKMNGLALCQRIRSQKSDTSPYIILLTSRSKSDDIVEGLLKGANDYVTKPFNNAELQARLQVGCRMLDLQAELQLVHKQLVHSEKMASIGHLAAGVAHEINNPIGFVNANISMLNEYTSNFMSLIDLYEQAAQLESFNLDTVKDYKSKIDFDFLKDDLTNLFNETSEGLHRVKSIVTDLQNFSRESTGEWLVSDLHEGLENTINVVSNELKYKADLVREYSEIPKIECIPSKLNQVFLNLLVNASHAIEEHGTVIIRTGLTQDDVWVEVEDSGCGISSEHMNHLFDPFFTTKAIGKGTGLGLSVSYGIVEKHGGRIDVKSEVGKGSVFRVILPQRQITT